jgi:hypothetical protein
MRPTLIGIRTYSSVFFAMMTTNSVRFLVKQSHQPIGRARDIMPHWREAVRKPATFAYILLTAHKAQIALIILLLIMIFLAPAVVDFITSTVFPPETSKKVFGLIKTQQASPWKDAAYTVVMTVCWAASILSTLLLFWFHIPIGLARANARAAELRTEADRSSDAVQRRILYQRALTIATDPELSAGLESQLREEIAPPRASSSTIISEMDRPQSLNETFPGTSGSAFRRDGFSSPTSLSGRYDLVEKIGSGAMGVVYSARDTVLDRKVAIKQLSITMSGENEYILRFRREAQILARLNHPNVVQVYDLLEQDGRLWMVVEYVDGGDLASYLKNRERLMIGQAVSFVVPIAEGLASAHSQGIVHRDLKPANILLTSGQTPKITDFGIAKLTQSIELTQTGSVLGSPPYMSPEQCSGGTVDLRTDIYALGITLYELLTGKRPFEGEASSVLARHIIEQPPKLSEHLENIPLELEDVVMRMLAKNPNDRPSDMTTVVELLSKFIDEAPSSERQTGHSNVLNHSAQEIPQL